VREAENVKNVHPLFAKRSQLLLTGPFGLTAGIEFIEENGTGEGVRFRKPRRSGRK
jgi:hypothetical protein